MTPNTVVPSIPLEGNALLTVNEISFAVIGGFAVVGVLGKIADTVWRRRAKAQSNSSSDCRYSLAALLFYSYVLLAPGLFATLFSFNVSLFILGFTKALKEETESMVGLIGSLFNKNLLLGAFLVMLYSMIIPAIKIVLLGLGEFWRNSDSPDRVKKAGQCIRMVQAMSKWACPDLFAYILMAYLFRSLHHPPHLLSSFQLDVGFTCFSVFCIGSTLATLGLRVPGNTEVSADGQQRCKSNRLLLPGVIALASACFVFLAVGVWNPSMNLRMDLELLYEQKPNLKPLAPILDRFRVQELMYSEVSVWRCACALARWSLQGEVTAAIAFVMYVVFVVAMTVCNMCVLVLAAIRLAATGGCLQERIRPIIELSRSIKKLSMLDVSVMGVVVVVMSLRSLRAKGVIISIQYGLYFLLAAELCHYLAFWLVTKGATSLMGNDKCGKNNLAVVSPSQDTIAGSDVVYRETDSSAVYDATLTAV